MLPSRISLPGVGERTDPQVSTAAAIATPPSPKDSYVPGPVPGLNRYLFHSYKSLARCRDCYSCPINVEAEAQRGLLLTYQQDQMRTQVKPPWDSGPKVLPTLLCDCLRGTPACCGGRGVESAVVGDRIIVEEAGSEEVRVRKVMRRLGCVLGIRTLV